MRERQQHRLGAAEQQREAFGPTGDDIGEGESIEVTALTLYLQKVLGLSALLTGLVFLPAGS
nr:hypothetical protein [Ktedonobacteraceae bacterium]